MLPDQVSNPGPLTYESGALQIALRGQAITNAADDIHKWFVIVFSEKIRLDVSSESFT